MQTADSRHVEISAKLERHFRDYQEDHRTPGNQLCHSFGLPIVTITTLGLLSRLVIGPSGFVVASDLVRLDAGTLLWMAGTVWYLFLDWKMAMPFSLFALGLYFLGRALPLPAAITLFLIGWGLQLMGHAVYEKRFPVLTSNINYLIIGPLWMFARLIEWLTGSRFLGPGSGPAPNPKI